MRFKFLTYMIGQLLISLQETKQQNYTVILTHNYSIGLLNNVDDSQPKTKEQVTATAHVLSVNASSKGSKNLTLNLSAVFELLKHQKKNKFEDTFKGALRTQLVTYKHDREFIRIYVEDLYDLYKNAKKSHGDFLAIIIPLRKSKPLFSFPLGDTQLSSNFYRFT